MAPIGKVKIALVTGASGFIGRRLCATLNARQVRVRGLMRNARCGPWDELVVADIGNDALSKATMSGIDTVFHLAGKVHALSAASGDGRDYVRINVEGTRALLREAVAAGVKRFIFFSSVKAMGEGGNACMDETWEARPETPYGRSKLAAEQLVTEIGRCHRMHVVNLRLPLVYGFGCKGNLAGMIHSVSRGRFPPLAEYENKRSMVHVDDVVLAALLCVGDPRAAGQTYIVTDGTAYSTREIYTKVVKALGKDVPSWTIPTVLLRGMAKFGDLVCWTRGKRFVFDSDALEKLTCSAWYSSEKIRTELGFRPSCDLRQALPEMVADLR